MTTATLTWSGQYSGSAAAGATIADCFAALNSSLVAAQAETDFPWTVCSSDLVHASTRYITLKPKSGASGRILFLFAVTSTDGQWNTNIQLSTAVPSSHLVVCYRSGATSDTPANIRNSSAALFTGEVQADSTPVTNNVNATMTAGEFWDVAANDEMVVAFNTSSTHAWDTARRIFAAGKILVDPVSDDARSGALHASSAAWLPNTAINAASSVGVMSIGGGGIEHWGKLGDPDGNFMAAKSRDNAAKKIFFPPIQLGSYQAAPGRTAFRYQLRQMAYQAPCLAGKEPISDGTTTFATSVGSASSGVAWWLLNFKPAA